MTKTMEQELWILTRRLEFIKGLLKETAPMLDEAYQEIYGELIWALEEDQEGIADLAREFGIKIGDE